MNLSSILHLTVRASKDTLALFVTAVEALFHMLAVTKRVSLWISEGGQDA